MHILDIYFIWNKLELNGLEYIGDYECMEDQLFAEWMVSEGYWK